MNFCTRRKLGDVQLSNGALLGQKPPKLLLVTEIEETVRYALRGEGDVAEKIQTLRPSDLGISSITLAELRFGAGRSGSRRLRRLIDGFVGDIDVVAFDEEAAGRFGKVAATLASKGTPIGALDTMLAAHALHLGLTLVTHNQKTLSERSRTKDRGLDVGKAANIFRPLAAATPAGLNEAHPFGSQQEPRPRRCLHPSTAEPLLVDLT